MDVAVTTVADVVGAAVVTTVLVWGRLEDAAAPATQHQMATQMTIGRITKNTNAATETPTAIPTTFTVRRKTII